MPTPYAQEYTTEFGPQYEASMLNQIDQSEGAALGQVRQKRSEGGLDAQASAGAEEGAIESGTENARASAVGNFNMEVANKKYSERMTDEAQAYQDTERQKQEDFQKSLTIMGYEHDDAMQAGEIHAAERGQLVGGAFGLAESGMKAGALAFAG
jgi:hypothetical protein